MSNISYGETLLREYVKYMLPMFEYVYNYRPSWLYGLEIDIYFPQLKAGLEFQGDQHYCHTEFGEPTAQKKRDQTKRRLCKQQDVLLITLDAIHLEYTRLQSKFKCIFRRNGRNSRPDAARLKPKMPLGYNKLTELQELNRKSTAYRRQLISSYDSPTAHRQKGKPRKEAMNCKNQI